MNSNPPPDSLARLRVVQRVNEALARPQTFTDSVVATAAALAGTLISAVTIVGRENVEVAARRGLDVGGASRAHSFCAHAILGRDHFVVEDAQRDARFCDNPFVLGAPYIRFYAGFTLVVSEQRVGALCVVDDRPRVLSAEQIHRLQMLATGTSAWLALEIARKSKATTT